MGITCKIDNKENNLSTTLIEKVNAFQICKPLGKWSDIFAFECHWAKKSYKLAQEY